MKPIKIFFDFNGYTVTAGGRVWDSLFIDRMFFKVEDENYNEVLLNKSEYDIVKELAEELILSQYDNREIYF